MNDVPMWIAVIAAAILASEFVRSVIERMQASRARMMVASRSLEDYAQALETAVCDPQVSPLVKDALLDISRTVMDRRAACMLRDFLAGDAQPQESGEDELVHAMAVLGQRAPNSHEAVMAAMKLGLVALIVQWPDTYRDIMRLTLALAEENSSRIVRKVSSFQTYRHRPSPAPNYAYGA